MIRWAGNVCDVGVRYFGHLRQLGAAATAVVDPRRLYAQEHHKLLKLLKREHGGTLRHVKGIDMKEARNFGDFVDRNSVRGLSQAVSFAIGCLMGARRPRTITSIRLRDCQMYADEVQVERRSVLVPGIRIEYQDEKVDDIQVPTFRLTGTSTSLSMQAGTCAAQHFSCTLCWCCVGPFRFRTRFKLLQMVVACRLLSMRWTDICCATVLQSSGSTPPLSACSF